MSKWTFGVQLESGGTIAIVVEGDRAAMTDDDREFVDAMVVRVAGYDPTARRKAIAERKEQDRIAAQMARLEKLTEEIKGR